MRIWSIHPKHLDTKGLVALWRETLLAQHVLEEKTKGYKNHPQLDRFKDLKNPVDAINQYLSIVYQTASDRGYNFNREKINWNFKRTTITVTTGQIEYELKHLLNKLKIRDFNKYKELTQLPSIDTHPMFKIIEGEIESWEVL
jgi:hypothetical protein